MSPFLRVVIIASLSFVARYPGQRNVYPAALAKDRSRESHPVLVFIIASRSFRLLPVSKSGLDKSMPKNGAGPHNWGSYSELTHPYIHHNLETAKLPPQSQDFRGADDIDLDNVDDDETQETEMAASPSTAAALHADAPAEQDKTDEAPAGGKQRRMSSMTEEEREKARAWRHGAMNRDKGQYSSEKMLYVLDLLTSFFVAIKSTWLLSHELPVHSVSLLLPVTPSWVPAR